MRSDMSKVVTEKPRHGHKSESKKTSRRLSHNEYEDDDHGSTRHKMSMYSKEFSDVLGPLRRYLRKQVGRRWDDVNSELCKNLDKRTMSGRHIFTHINWEVEQHCYIGDDGKVYRNINPYSIRPVTGFYVHPTTRRLCYVQPESYRVHRREWASKHALLKKLETFLGNDVRYNRGSYDVDDWIIVDDVTLLERKDGMWYVHTYKLLDPNAVVNTKRINGREYPVLRCQTKLPMKQKIATRQIGRRDKTLWALVNDKAA